MNIKTEVRELTKYFEETSFIKTVSTNKISIFFGYRMIRSEGSLKGLRKQIKYLLLYHSLVRQCYERWQLRVRASVFLQ